LLRNRIAHHEPILRWDLGKHHRGLRDSTLCLSEPAFAWSDPLDRFDAAYPDGGVNLARNLAKD
jgi:hypothetical protein